MSSEPSVVVGLFIAMVISVINVLQAFGVPVTPGQEDELVKLVTAVLEFLVIGGGFLILRNFVYSRASVEKLTGVKDPVV